MGERGDRSRELERLECFAAAGGRCEETWMTWQVGSVEFWEGYCANPLAEMKVTGGRYVPATFAFIADAVREAKEAMEISGEPLELMLVLGRREGGEVRIILSGGLRDPLFCKVYVTRRPRLPLEEGGDQR